MNQKFFSARMIWEGTWVITGEGCDCYLLEGSDEAIMIDSGNSPHNIRAFAQTLTALPVRRVINTHAHFDHTGGNGFFDEVWTTRSVARGAKNVMGRRTQDIPLDYDFTYVKDGDIIDLAGRPLTIVGLNCHSPEDIAILDTTKRLLFPGDEVEAGQVLLLPGYAEQPGQIHACPAASVETCLGAMNKLKALSDQFDYICPAHNGTPIDPVYLDWYIQICNEILAGTEGDPDCTGRTYTPQFNHFPNLNANYRRYTYKGASLIYCADLIRDADYANADKLNPATMLHIISAHTAYPVEN